MNRRIAVRAVIIREGKLLCVKLKPYKTAITGEFWCTIGGGIDSGEALLPALTREVIEETGVTPIIGSLLYIQQYVSGETEHLEFFFHVTNTDDFETIDLTATSHGIEEIAEIDFIDTAKSTVFPEFLQKESFTDINAYTLPKIFNSL